jgi:hypothetical protein
LRVASDGRENQAMDALGPTVLTQWSTQLFAQLDSQQKGYIDRNDLQVALTSSVVPTSKTAPGEQLFQALDRNGDGHITQSELVASVQSLADRLFGNLRQTDAASVPQTGLVQDLQPQTSQQVTPAPADPALQLGNPGRMMSLLKLVDLVSAYGPTGQSTTPPLPGGGSLSIKA